MEKEICILKNFRNILDATTETDCTDLDNAIKIIEYAMKPKTCEGCKNQKIDIDRCDFCKRYYSDQYAPKDNA